MKYQLGAEKQNPRNRTTKREQVEIGRKNKERRMMLTN